MRETESTWTCMVRSRRVRTKGGRQGQIVIKGRYIDIQLVGEVHVLALANGLVVLDAALDPSEKALRHSQHERAVGDQNRRAWLD